MDVSAHFSALDDEEFFVVEGSGWRGRRESDYQVFCHPNSMHAPRCHTDKHMTSAPGPHHNHHNHHKAQTGCANLDFLCCTMMADPSGRPQSRGVARRRRERRLRSMLRHERMTVAMALAEFSHHSSRGQRMARAGVWGHEQNYTAKIRKPPTHQPELFSLEGEPGGGLPAPLSEVAGRQDMVVRHVMEDLGSVCPFVQILDLPVPQLVENVTDTLRILDLPIAEQVIEVPKISCSPCPSRFFGS